MVAELQAAGHVGLVIGPVPHALERFCERHARFENGFDPIGRAGRIRRRPERSKRAVDRGFLVLPHRNGATTPGNLVLKRSLCVLARRGKRDGQAAGDDTKADGSPTFARTVRRRATVRRHGRIIGPLDCARGSRMFAEGFGPFAEKGTSARRRPLGFCHWRTQ